MLTLSAGGRADDARWHAITLALTRSGTAEFTLDSNVLHGAADILGGLALPEPLFLGFSGRTGGANNNHWVRNVAFGTSGNGGHPAPVVSFVTTSEQQFLLQQHHHHDLSRLPTRKRTADCQEPSCAKAMG